MLFTLRDLQEAVALAATGDWAILCDAVPQDVWDSLHERGLVSTHQDITGDAETGATAAGIAYIVDRVRE